MSTRKASGHRGKGSSKGISFTAFETALTKGVSSLYAFLGTDTFLRTCCVTYVCEAAGETNEPCAPVTFDGERTDARTVFDELRTLPLLQERRVVCVDNAAAFIETCSETIDALPAFGKQSVLILLDNKLDGRRKLTKEVFAKGTVVDCNGMDENSLAAWLKKRISSAGQQADVDTVSAIIGRIGPSPAALDQAVEQLITYTGAETQITPKDVEQALPASTFEEVWNLIDGVAARNQAQSMAVIDRLMANGEPVQMVMGAFAWHVLRLLNAKYMIENGMTPPAICKELRIYYSKQRQFQSQLSTFTLPEIKKHLALLTQADVQLKTSGRSREQLILERTVLEMCG